MSRVFITGIAGFLGSHLASEMLFRGHQVYGNDNLLLGDKANVPPEVHYWIKADCCSEEFRREMLRIKPDVVYHCAATAHEGLSVFSPHFITRNIYEASVATFSAAIAAGVKRIVFMSSMARYGAGEAHRGVPFEEDYETNPQDPYGIAKVAAEQTLKMLCRAHGVEYVIAVPHNIVGVRQKYDDPARNVASIFLHKIIKGEPIYIYGDGNQQRCFSPVKDCLHSLVQLADAPVHGEVINIGPDEGFITINRLAEVCMDVVGKKVEVIHIEDRPCEVKQAYCSSDKARKLLGYKQQQDLKYCLAEMAREIKPKDFSYFFPLEIDRGNVPRTWKERLM